MSRPLTERQQTVLDLMRTAQQNGHSPYTASELASVLGLRPSAVRHALGTLALRGEAVKVGCALDGGRTWAPTGPGDHA